MQEASDQTKAQAKEAKRVEQEARNASNESRKALKTEKRAQKALFMVNDPWRVLIICKKSV